MKYVHIMPHQSLIHNRRLIRMFNDNPDYFKKDEHLFVVGFRKVYEAGLSDTKNVVLEEDIAKNYRKFRKYVDEVDFVFLHENTIVSMRTLLRLGRKRLNKIIWCVWGHDLYFEGMDKLGVLATMKRAISLRLRRVITKKFYAIGVGFKYDAVEVRKKYGDIKIVEAPYGYVRGNKEEIDRAIKGSVRKGPLKVMIGHSAYEFLNYYDTLGLLSKYKDEDILISMVLTYGKKEFGREVQRRAVQIFGEEKVEVIDELMSAEDYARYLNAVDICVFNFTKQAALGNFYELCYMGKKLFLRKGGVLDLAAKGEKMDVCYVTDIPKMDFAEFSNLNIDAKNEKKFGEYYMDEKNYLEAWKRTLDGLERGRKALVKRGRD